MLLILGRMKKENSTQKFMISEGSVSNYMWFPCFLLDLFPEIAQHSLIKGLCELVCFVLYGKAREMMPRFLKKPSELEANVNLIYQLSLPAPFSEKEICRLLENVASGIPIEALVLKVTKKRVIIRKSKEKKPFATFNRKDFAIISNVPDTDSIILVRKLNWRKQELTLIRFIEQNDLQKFWNIFSSSRNIDTFSRISFPPSHKSAQVPVREVQLHRPIMQSSLPNEPDLAKERTRSIEQEPACKHSHLAQRQYNKGLNYLNYKGCEKQYCSCPEVYIVKHVKCFKNNSRKEKYNKVTIYDVGSSSISDCSSMSIINSSPSTSMAS